MNKTKKKILMLIAGFAFFMLGAIPCQPAFAATSIKIPDIIILNSYSICIPIDGVFTLIAPNSALSHPSFRSSKSSVATVDNFGVIKGLSPGKCTITVKAGKATATCKVEVAKPTVTLSDNALTLDFGGCKQLYATVSSGRDVTWKSSSSSVASISDDGFVTAKKAGTTYITATSDKVSAKCKVTVNPPVLNLSKSSITLNAGKSTKLLVTHSPGIYPSFRSSKSSVATVDDTGFITAVGPGTAIITVKADKATKTCKITVPKPTLKFESSYLTLNPGDSRKMPCTVSTGAKPEYWSSKSSVATVDANGTIRAVDLGKAYIYAKVDGVKTSLKVTVEL